MSEWRRMRLGDVMSVKHGYAFPGAGFSTSSHGPQVLTPANFAIGGGFQRAKPKTFVGDYPTEFLLSEGQIVVTMTDLSKEGDTLGLAARLPAGESFLHNQRIGLVQITDSSQLDPNFFHYLTRTSAYRHHILGTASGSTVRHTSPGRIGDFVDSLPPVSEQRAIAEVLGALDDKIAANTALAQHAQRVASGVFDAVTSSWPSVRMSEILDPILGGTPSRARSDFWEPADHLWISARDVTAAPVNVVLDTAEKISSAAVSETKAKPLPAGSVILTARGTVGEVARLAVPASFNQSCYGFRPDVVPPSLLYFSLLRASERAKSVAHGSVFDTITKATFDHLDLAWSPSAAQAAEAQLAPLLGVVTASLTENRTLAATRDTLLPQLMSGELRVGDAENIASDAGA